MSERIVCFRGERPEAYREAMRVQPALKPEVKQGNHGWEVWRDLHPGQVAYLTEAEALEAELERYRDVGERMLRMTINGVLCQQDDACPQCAEMWRDLRHLLDGAVNREAA